MDGENHGKPYEQMDDLGVTLFLETPIYWIGISTFFLGSWHYRHIAGPREMPWKFPAPYVPSAETTGCVSFFLLSVSSEVQIMANQPTHSQPYDQGLLTIWFPLIRPYFTIISWGGYVRGGMGWPAMIRWNKEYTGELCQKPPLDVWVNSDLLKKPIVLKLTCWTVYAFIGIFSFDLLGWVNRALIYLLNFCSNFLQSSKKQKQSFERKPRQSWRCQTTQ